MDLIAHWLKDEPSLHTELQDAMLAMGQQLNETPEAGDWPLKQWQSWLEENSFDLALLQQALQQLFANAGEAEPYTAICEELSQQPGDAPGIKLLLICAEQHSEKLVPELLEQLEAEAKATEKLNKTSGGSSSHHKLAQNMSNHRTAWSVSGGVAGAALGMFLINRGWYGLKMRAAANRMTCIAEQKAPPKSILKTLWDGGNPDSLAAQNRFLNITDGREVGYTQDVQFTQTYTKHLYGNTWDRKYANWKSFFKGTLQDLDPRKIYLSRERNKKYRRDNGWIEHDSDDLESSRRPASYSLTEDSQENSLTASNSTRKTSDTIDTLWRERGHASSRTNENSPHQSIDLRADSENIAQADTESNNDLSQPNHDLADNNKPLPKEDNDYALKQEKVHDLQKQLAQIEEGIKTYDRNLLNFEKYKLEEERDKIKSELNTLEAESKETTEAKLKASKDEFKTDEASFNNKMEIIE